MRIRKSITSILFIAIAIGLYSFTKNSNIYARFTCPIQNDSAKIVRRFLQQPANASIHVINILSNIAKTEKATPFLIGLAGKYGFPVWDKMFGSNNNKLEAQTENELTLKSKKAYYFIPFTDSSTGQSKAFIYCQKINDSIYKYKIYDIEVVLKAKPTTELIRKNIDAVLGFVAYFEKQINGSVKTEAFKNNKFSNVDILMVDKNKLKQGEFSTIPLTEETAPSEAISYLIQFFNKDGSVIEKLLFDIRVPL